MNLRRLIWNAPFLSDAKRVEWFPPFWLMRIKVLELSESWRTVRILLPQTWLSKNVGGNIFGGFQSSLADPIAAMACVRNFSDCSVWTRALTMDFHTEGDTDLQLRFHFSSEQEAVIRDELASKGRSTPSFEYGYYLADGTQCTTIKATVAIRPKGYHKPTSPDFPRVS